MKLFHVLPFLLVPMIGASITGQTLDARFSTSVYAWENQYADSSASSSFKAYQTASFHASGIWMPELSIHGYLRTSHDFGTETNNNPEYRVYNLYARWFRKTDNYRVETRVGRQAIAGAVRYVSADAIRIDYSNGSDYQAMAFFGTLLPPDGTLEVLKPFERRAMGARVSTSKFLGTRAAVSFLDKAREGAYYFTPNITNDDSLAKAQDLKERMLAVDVEREFFRSIYWNYRTHFDLLESRVHLLSSDVKYAPTDDWHVAVQYAYRRPNVYYSAILPTFEPDDMQANQEVWLRGYYRINEVFSVDGEYANVFYKWKDAWRFGFGFGFWRSHAGYQRRMGYGGTMDIVTLSSYYPLTTSLNVSGNVSYARWDLADDMTASRIPDDIYDTNLQLARQALKNTSSSVSASLRLNYLLGRSVNVDVEGQFLSQDVQSSPVYAGSKYDLRCFVRANYWIFQKL